jgi:para-nitrobenzyl esterase
MSSAARALVLLIAFTRWLPGYAQGESVQIHTGSGALLGTVSDGVRSFKGVPYAAAPVGDLRWRAPRPPMHWSQPLSAASLAGPMRGLQDWRPDDIGPEIKS